MKNRFLIVALFCLIAGILIPQSQIPSTAWVQSNVAALPSGTIVLTLSSCPAGFSESSTLNGKMLRGTLAANGDVGGSGGSATITPTGAVSQATFSGSPGTVPAETFTGTPGTVPAQTFTGSSATTSAVSAGTPAGTNSVPSFSGDAITSVINHTHAVNVTDPGHVHTAVATTFTEQAQGGTTASTTGTHLMTSAATGGSLRSSGETTVSKAVTLNSATTGITATSSNPVGGVSSITPTGSVTASIFTGNALGTHTHTLTAAGTNSTAAFTPAGTNSTASFTPSGTISSQSFTGAAIDPSPSYVKVIFCSKN